jgi:hypothetical protein
MNPSSPRTNIFRRGGLCITLVMSAVFSVSACGGSDSSEGSASALSESAATSTSSGAAASSGASSTAPLGTGFIMMSAISQLQLTEPSYLEESDCTARLSALGDAGEYAGCMEIPSSALCLQLAEGTRESDKWWECYTEEAGCEEAHAAHEVVREVGGYVREILQDCVETEMTLVFASM